MNSSDVYNISSKINELIDNSIFKKDSVDAILQDSSIKLYESSKGSLYTVENLYDKINVKKLMENRDVLCFFAKRITETAISEDEKVNAITKFVSII